MTKKRNYPMVISGAGGGKGGSPRAAVEAENSLRSKQIAHIIDLLGEGEWEGLVDGPAGIYLNGVALFTPDAPTGDVVDFEEATSEDGAWLPAGTWNFKGITLEFRNGTQSQSAIRSASSAASVQTVNLAVTNGTPVTTAINNPNIDVAIVNVQVDQLYKQNPENGDINGYYVDLKVEARYDSGSWTTIKVDRIQGKCMSAYIRTYTVDLSALNENGPWLIRVTRISPDDASAAEHSMLRFVGVGLMSRDKFRYPNSVLASIGVDASQLNSIPTRSYDCKMARVLVPSNYNPITRVYTGVWNGTFQTAWTDNPAWCLYDMITNERYGLGEYVDEDLTDKWALYTIGQYCDELVPDGFGGTEPRFTINAYFQTAEEAISLIQNMASIFRGILYYLNESLTALQDAPSDPVYQFNTTNVEEGIFSYAGASGSTRHSVVMVVWNNPEINYKQDIEVVEDRAGLLRFGYRPVTVQALGCTSRGQAHRLGLWTLYVEQYEADIVSFSTSLEGTGVQPGNIVEIYDPTRANIRLGGRVLNVVGQEIFLDKAVELTAGTHTVSFIADDGTLTTRLATVGNGEFSSLMLNGFGTLPSIGSVFGIQMPTVQAQQFRIISIVESAPHKYDITAVAHNNSKYNYIENGLTLAERPIRAIRAPQAAVTDILFTENLYLLADGSICNRLIISWTQNQRATAYAISFKKGTNNWSPETMVDKNQFIIPAVTEGWEYSFRVAAITIDGVRGNIAEESYTVLGAKAPPPPFDVFEIDVSVSGTRSFTFKYTSTPVPLDYLGAQIRYKVGSGHRDWDTMLPLGSGFYTASPMETGQLAAGTYTFACRAEDQTHSLSTVLYRDESLTDSPSEVIDGIADGVNPDLTPPPTPTGFSVVAALSHIFVEHANPTYTQGRGHGKTRLYGVKYTGGALPTFASATQLAEFTGNIFAYPSALGTQWRLWIKWVSLDGAASTTPAGGTNGLLAATGLVGGADLTDQIITAAKLADGALTLSKFSSTIRPIEIVAALPATGNFEGRTVYLTTDDKIYRHTGSPTTAAGFTKSTDGADILANSIVANSIQAGAITAVKLAANAIAVGTAAIQNGAIVNAMIGNAAIDTAKIADLAVVNAKIASLDATKLTSGVIDAGRLTVGTLSSVVNGGTLSGQRVEISTNVVKVYDASNVLRVKLGNLLA